VLDDVDPFGEVVVRDPCVPFLERDSQFSPGQVGPETTVRPNTEGDVVVG
jgi:hypothetical protein